MATVAVVLEPVRGRVGEVPDVSPTSLLVVASSAAVGEVGEVRHFADHVIAERGVRHGRLVLVPVDEKTETHTHGDARATPHSHLHIRRR